MSMSETFPTFGLTGGVACGKSTVARCFEDLGAKIIDADHIGHALVEPGQPAYEEIVQRFGEDILNAARGIDRRKLGPRVFASMEERRALNTILHPRIIQRMEELAQEYHTRQPRAVVIADAPLLFETGIDGSFRKVIVVWCRPEQQLERLMAKTGISPEDAERRVRAQMPVEEKRRRADYLVDNSGSLEFMQEQVQAIFPKLQRIVEGK